MDKAVLVMDMPEKCSECKFSNPDGILCPFHGEISYLEYGSKKPDDCPLRPMPEKKPLKGDMHNVQRMAEEIEAASWNACIDAISGKTD